jgi:hypothetical protein
MDVKAFHSAEAELRAYLGTYKRTDIAERHWMDMRGLEVELLDPAAHFLVSPGVAIANTKELLARLLVATKVMRTKAEEQPALYDRGVHESLLMCLDKERFTLNWLQAQAERGRVMA